MAGMGQSVSGERKPTSRGICRCCHSIGCVKRSTHPYATAADAASKCGEPSRASSDVAAAANGFASPLSSSGVMGSPASRRAMALGGGGRPRRRLQDLANRCTRCIVALDSLAQNMRQPDAQRTPSAEKRSR